MDLFGAKSKEDVLTRIRQYAKDNKDKKFIFGYGWNPAMLGGVPTAKDLDEAVQDRPAMIFDFTIHDLWFNTAALKAAGVNKDTKDKKAGFSYWVRDEKGNPTGVGIEVVWIDAYIAAGAWNPEVIMRDSQKILFDAAAKRGWTSVINQGLITPNLSNLPELNKDIDKNDIADVKKHRR